MLHESQNAYKINQFSAKILKQFNAHIFESPISRALESKYQFTTKFIFITVRVIIQQISQDILV